MKRIFVVICTVLINYFSLSAQCVPLPQTGIPGLSPMTENLDCAERGMPYNEVIHFENFSTFFNGLITVDWLRIDSITNVPCGLEWSTNPGNTFLTSETGCIDVSGITFDPPGQYKLGIYVCVKISGLIDTTACGRADELVAAIETILGVSTGVNFNYWLRITNKGVACTPLDTLAPDTAAINLTAGCDPVIAPCAANLPTGTTGLTPNYDNLPCIEQGTPYDETIFIENFDSLAFPSAGVTAKINYLRVDSILNVPCDVTWKTDKPHNAYGPGETGCIQVTGTTFDNLGQYKLEIYITLSGVINNLLPITLSGEASELVDSLQNQFGVAVNIDLNYWIRVNAPGASCQDVDTLPGANNLTASDVCFNLTILSSAGTEICEDTTTDLTAQVSGGGATPFTFNWGDGPTTNPALNGKGAGTYSVTVTDANSATYSASITIDEIPLPIAGFTYAIIGPTTVSFTNSSQHATSYIWNFGDQNGSSDEDIVHTYLQQDTYTVDLTAVNSCGTDVATEPILLTSIFDNTLGSHNIRAYPNPNNGRFEVIITDPLLNSDYLFKILDIQGKTIFSKDMNVESNLIKESIVLNNDIKGIYFLQVISNSSSYIERITIN